MICSKCGKQLKDGLNFCVSCGNRIVPQGAFNAGPDPARTVASPVGQAPPPPRLPMTPISVAPPSGIKRRSGEDLLNEIQEKYKIPLVAIMIAMVAGIIAFSTANYKRTEIEKPVQYEKRDDGAYFSTTSSLSRFNKDGGLEWKVSEYNGRPLRGLLEFDFDADGNIYVANTVGRSIEKYSADGEWLLSIGTNSLDDVFTFIVLENGNILTAESSEHRLQLFSPTGETLAAVGKRGVAKDMFSYPNGLVEMPDGTIMVVDTNNLRFVRYDSDLNPLDTIPLTRRAVSFHSDSDEPVIIKRLDEESDLDFISQFPCRATLDPARELMYVSFFNDFDSNNQSGSLGVFDYNGNFKEMKFFENNDSRRINPNRMRMTPSGTATVVDTHSFHVAEWNPDDNSISEEAIQGVVRDTNAMRTANKSNNSLYAAGILMFSFGLLVLFGLLGYVKITQNRLDSETQRIYSAAAANAIAPSPEAPAINASFIEYIKREDVSQADMTRAVLKFMAHIFAFILILIAVIIYLASVHQTGHVLSHAEKMYYLLFMIAAEVIIAMALIMLVFVRPSNVVVIQRFETMKALKRLSREIHLLLSENEAFHCAILYPPREVLILTSQRLIWADTLAKWNLFSKQSIFRERPLKEFTGARIERGFLKLPYSKIVLTPVKGKNLVISSLDRQRLENIAEALNATLKAGCPEPRATANAAASAICPRCSHPLVAKEPHCPGCGVKFKNPKIAAALSLLICGGGQLYNRQYLEGAYHMISTVFTASIFFIYFARLASVSRIWMIGTVAQYIVVCAISAYTAWRDASNTIE